jgi:hypothetical protein
MSVRRYSLQPRPHPTGQTPEASSSRLRGRDRDRGGGQRLPGLPLTLLVATRAHGVAAGPRGGRLPPGGPSGTPPALLYRSPTLTLEGRGHYVGSVDGFGLARCSSASSSRCITSSLRIRS